MLDEFSEGRETVTIAVIQTSKPSYTTLPIMDFGHLQNETLYDLVVQFKAWHNPALVQEVLRQIADELDEYKHPTFHRKYVEDYRDKQITEENSNVRL